MNIFVFNCQALILCEFQILSNINRIKASVIRKNASVYK